MKKILFSLTVFVVSIAMSSQSASAQNNCANITLSVAPVFQQELFPGAGVTQASYTLHWNVNSGASKTLEININGSSIYMSVSGSGSLSPDLLVSLSTPLVVTVTTYTSSQPGKGRVCDSQTQTGQIVW